MIKKNHSSIVHLLESAGEILKDYFKQLESLSVHNKPGEDLFPKQILKRKNFL